MQIGQAQQSHGMSHIAHAARNSAGGNDLPVAGNHPERGTP